MKKIMFLALFATIATCYAQDYNVLIKKADSCYQAKNYKIATEYFAKAIKINPESKNNYYNASCAASLANNKQKSLKWLEIAIDYGFDNLDHINLDSDLDNIRNEKKFKQIISDLRTKTELIEAKYDKPLKKELLEIYKLDQNIRNEYTSAQKKYGFQAKVVDSLGNVMLLRDSLNLIRVLKILDEKGWVGKDKVGQQANQTLFLVIQHSDLKIQQKYLPMMREAVKNGNAKPSHLALMEDRVALREGRKQIYGSQIGANPISNKPYVLPLEDPNNVDKRRADVGLEPLAEYVNFWNITWNVEQYKKDLLEVEKLSAAVRED